MVLCVKKQGQFGGYQSGLYRHVYQGRLQASRALRSFITSNAGINRITANRCRLPMGLPVRRPITD
ncbi:MAG: hypothetical protein EBW05_02705, partial [Betaproteobacteria bacterium]|nr:hypothetical protein [Betaproteobacteria bacterium]